MISRRQAYTFVGVLLIVALVAVLAEDGYGHNRDRARVVHMVYEEFGRTQVAACMVEIIDRETGGTFYARAANWTDHHSDGSRGSFGLLQVGALHRRPGESVRHFAERMWRPRENLRLAHRLYDRSGFAPWGGWCG